MFDFFVDIRDISKPMAMIPQSEKNISWRKMLQKGVGEYLRKRVKIKFG
jgi:hypothetical protein